MPSRIRHIVEPTVGWLFVLVLVIALGAALLAASQSTVEVTGRIQTERAH
jgi:hypothetical protein